MAEAETGLSGNPKIRLTIKQEKRQARRWTKEEDLFLLDNYLRMSEPEIARHLGRSVQAVHLRIFRSLHHDSATKHDSVLTAEQIGKGLGKDSKSIHLLFDRKILPGWKHPSGCRTRLVDKMAFIKWVNNPENFIYFQPERIGALRTLKFRPISIYYNFRFWEDVREMVLRTKKSWGDEWLSTAQAAKHLKIEIKSYKLWKLPYRRSGHNINASILKGFLKARRWGNWWVRRSDLPPANKTIDSHGNIVDRKRASHSLKEALKIVNQWPGARKCV